MRKYTVFTTLGDTGVVMSENPVIEGQAYTVKMHDCNGNAFSGTRVVEEVLDCEDPDIDR